MVSPAALEDCPELPKIPEIKLKAEQVEAYWLDDRVAYVECRGKHKELAQTIYDRTVQKKVLKK